MKELKPDYEAHFRSSIDRKLTGLSPNNLRELALITEFTREEVNFMRGTFREAGYDVEFKREDLHALRRSQLRARPYRIKFEGDRGEALVKLLGNDEASEFIKWSYKTSVKELGWKNHKIGGVNYSQGRSLSQALLDLAGYVVDPLNRENYLLHLQRISWLGLRRKYVFGDLSSIQLIEETFKNVDKPKKPYDFAALPPGGLIAIWNHIITE